MPKMKGGEKMEIEIRSADEVVISGYVNAVERDSRIMPKGKGSTAVRSFVERVSAGTFRNAIESAEKPIELRFNHSRVLCDTSTGLTLYEDNIGLHATAVVHDAEVAEKARRRELRGWSFGFISEGEKWEKLDGIDRRILDKIDLQEVTITDRTPAYVGTSIETRSEEANVIETRGTNDEVQTVKDNTPPKVPYSVENKKKEIEILRMRGNL